MEKVQEPMKGVTRFSFGQSFYCDPSEERIIQKGIIGFTHAQLLDCAKEITPFRGVLKVIPGKDPLPLCILKTAGYRYFCVPANTENEKLLDARSVRIIPEEKAKTSTPYENRKTYSLPLKTNFTLETFAEKYFSSVLGIMDAYEEFPLSELEDRVDDVFYSEEKIPKDVMRFIRKSFHWTLFDKKSDLVNNPYSKYDYLPPLEIVQPTKPEDNSVKVKKTRNFKPLEKRDLTIELLYNHGDVYSSQFRKDFRK